MQSKRDLEIIRQMVGSLQTKRKKKKGIRVRDLKPTKDAKGGQAPGPGGKPNA
jgi:hypothetical protein